MKLVFGVLGILLLVASLAMCTMSKTAFQETTGAIIALVGVLALGVAALLEEIQRSRAAVQEQFRFLGEFLRERLK